MSAQPPEWVDVRRPTRWERLRFRLWRRWPESYVDARLSNYDLNTRRGEEWLRERFKQT